MNMTFMLAEVSVQHDPGCDPSIGLCAIAGIWEHKDTLGAEAPVGFGAHNRLWNSSGVGLLHRAIRHELGVLPDKICKVR